MTLRSTDLDRLAELLDDTAKVLRTHKRQIVKRAISDRDDGFGPGGGGGRSSGVSDPTGTAAIRGRGVDQVRAKSKAIESNLRPAYRTVDLIRTNALGLLAISTDEARKLDAAAKAIYSSCSVCSRVVKGTPEDRLKSSRCPACYEYLRRNGEERPRALWDQAGTTTVTPAEWKQETGIHLRISTTDGPSNGKKCSASEARLGSRRGT